MLNEIDFASAQALGSYKAKHKMRPTTVVNVAGKKKKAVDVLGKDAFKDKIGLVCSSSGGPANKYTSAMKNQFEHLGMKIISDHQN